MKKLISTWYMSYHGMEIAKDCLKNGGSIQEALKHAIQDVESNPAFHSVGTGGLPNQEGRGTFDIYPYKSDKLDCST